MSNSEIFYQSIIQTKIVQPPVRNAIDRERLYKKMDGAGDRKLTVVSAPAGYGKTTLVTSWLEKRGLQHCWINLDRFDTAAQQVLNYFDAVLYKLKPDESERVSSGKVKYNSITSIINRMLRFQSELIVVLDDYHLADTAEIRELISIILEHLPGQVHIVLITRVDPQLHTARLRGQNQLLEITESDLQFSTGEVRSFLVSAARISLGMAEIEYLTRSTEGWIAGLQIIVASLRENPQPERYIHKLSSDNRYLFEYMIEEVMNRLDENTIDFLLKCSLFDRITAGLCNEITGRRDAQIILDYLDTHNLFISPLDSENCWYRLHHLFGNMLFSSCIQKYGEELPRFYLLASKWFESKGYYVEAIDCMLKTEDRQRTVELIEQYAEQILMQGELTALMRWIEKIPQEIL